MGQCSSGWWVVTHQSEGRWHRVPLSEDPRDRFLVREAVLHWTHLESGGTVSQRLYFRDRLDVLHVYPVRKTLWVWREGWVSHFCAGAADPSTWSSIVRPAPWPASLAQDFFLVHNSGDCLRQKHTKALGPVPVLWTCLRVGNWRSSLDLLSGHQ